MRQKVAAELFPLMFSRISQWIRLIPLGLDIHSCVDLFVVTDQCFLRALPPRFGELQLHCRRIFYLAVSCDNLPHSHFFILSG